MRLSAIRFSGIVIPLALTCATCGNFVPPHGNEVVDAPQAGKKKLELHGHRGARGLAPENTWPAFEIGIKSGMTAVELDVILTADGELVIHHDAFTNPKLCRNDDGSGIRAIAIHQLNLDYLKKLDCGSLKNQKFPEQKEIPLTRLMSLGDFFEHVHELEKTEDNAKKVIVNIDVKIPVRMTPTDAYLRELARLILKRVSDANMTKRIMVQSFEIRLLPFVKELSPQVRTAALFKGSKQPEIAKRSPEIIIQKAKTAQVDIIAPHLRDTDEKLIALAHQNGFDIIVWTVNEPNDMRKLLRLGVDGLISDYPDRLKAVAEEFAK